MATYEQRLVAGLLARGWERTKTNSRYQAFCKEPFTFKLFVGASGALRSGKSASESNSIGCPTMGQTEFYTMVLRAGDKALGINQPAPDAALAAVRSLSREQLLAIVAGMA